MLARMASIESRSSLPPHIHPPMAQAPKMIGVTRTPESPRGLDCMAEAYARRGAQATGAGWLECLRASADAQRGGGVLRRDRADDGHRLRVQPASGRTV